MRTVKPTPRRSLSALAARQARDKELAAICKTQPRAQRPAIGTRVPEPAVSLTALANAPKAHAVPASGDKLQDKRLEELARARATPLLRRNDVALSDGVTDQTSVRGTTDGATVRRLRELLTKRPGLAPVADSAIRPVYFERVEEIRVTAAYDNDRTVTDNRPTRVQQDAVSAIRKSHCEDAKNLALRRSAEAFADRLRWTAAARMFGPASVAWRALLPST